MISGFNIKYFCSICALCICVIIFSANGLAQGFIIPVDDIQSDNRVVPILRSHNVQVSIRDQAAQVDVEQTFSNPGKTPLEGIYYFPVPKDAAVSDFAIYVNGKRVQGELLEREEARRIYIDIVRKKIDPALLEFVDCKLFRAKIFPIPPNKNRRVTLQYNELLKSKQGLIKFLYPLRGDIKAERAIVVDPRHLRYDHDESDSNTSQVINVKLHSSIAIKNIYSPSHKIEVLRKSDYLALISYEGKRQADSDDFILYYGLEQSDFGVNLMTYRMDRDKDGYFMLLISPKVKIPGYKILNKDVIFVLDVSGSMAGEKIHQAKEALKFCINNLKKKDRFNIITFGVEPKLFQKTFVNAANYRQQALEFLNRIETKGGTNINEALLTALDMHGGSSQSETVVFITDGLPTVGVTDVAEILKNVKRLNVHDFRIFTFGVGYDVNTLLLDGIAKNSHAVSDYIEPHEDIEVAISSFYEKISHPVLSSLELDFGDIAVNETYPKELPDLFKGGQLTIIGKYENSDKTYLTLSGQLSNVRKIFEYALDFPELDEENEFLPRLWATRKIGYLLEQIRLNGENQELKEAIIELSKAFGIVTPYTSYLVHEDDFIPLAHISSDETYLSLGSSPFDATALPEPVGKKAVAYSRTLRKLREAEAADLINSRIIRHVWGRNFILDKNGYWTDFEFDTGQKITHIKYGSEVYFQLLKLYPEIRKFFSLGEKVIFKFKGKFINVGDRGIENLTEEELINFFDK
ncbi:MAG: VIT domain-containing protein [bacterium]